MRDDRFDYDDVKRVRRIMRKVKITLICIGLLILTAILYGLFG